MKKLLIGLLAVSSVSAFTQELNPEKVRTQLETAKLSLEKELRGDLTSQRRSELNKELSVIYAKKTYLNDLESSSHQTYSNQIKFFNSAKNYSDAIILKDLKGQSDSFVSVADKQDSAKENAQKYCANNEKRDSLSELNSTPWQPASLDQLRSAFNQKALSDGLSSGIEVYHTGPYFNSSYGGGGVSFDASFCIDLGFWSAGDCDSYGTQSYEDILLDQLNNGVFKKVSSSSSSSVTYQEPTGIMSNNYGAAEYTYKNSEAKTFDRNSSSYKKMLGLDIPEENIIESKVSPVTITMTSGQQVVGQVLEIFIGSSYYGGANITDVKRYVLSTNLPLMANPVAVISGVGYGYYGAHATVSGYLGFLGTTVNSTALQGVQRIEINQLHIPQGSFNGTIQYNLVQNVTIGYDGGYSGGNSETQKQQDELKQELCEVDNGDLSTCNDLLSAHRISIVENLEKMKDKLRQKIESNGFHNTTDEEFLAFDKINQHLYEIAKNIQDIEILCHSEQLLSNPGINDNIENDDKNEETNLKATQSTTVKAQ